MRILITFTMWGDKMVPTLKPLIESKYITELFVVTNFPGPDLPNTRYYYPSTFFLKLPIIRIIIRLLYMTDICLFKKPRVIIAHQLITYGLLSFFCSKLFKIPSVICLIGDDLNVWCETKFIGNILIHILDKCDFITVTGEVSKEKLEENKIFTKKAYVFPTMGDLSSFYPTITSKEYDVVSVGRLSSEKRIDILLKAIFMVKESFKDLKVGIIGDGPMKDELEKMCGELGLRGNVKFLGFKRNVEYYFNKAKIYVLTSEREGLPLAMIEAMSCGTVPIVPDIGDIKDVAKNYVNSIIVKPLDVEGFANSVIKLLKDEKFHKRLSQNASKIRETHSIKHATEIWDQIFECIGIVGKENK